MKSISKTQLALERENRIAAAERAVIQAAEEWRDGVDQVAGNDDKAEVLIAMVDALREARQ